MHPRTHVPTPRFERQLRPDNRTNAGRQRGAMEARRAVHAVAIEQRQRRVAVIRRLVDQQFRQRGRFEKAEGGGGVKFNVHWRSRDRRLGDWFGD